VGLSSDYRKTIEGSSHKLGTNNGLAKAYPAMNGTTIEESVTCVKTQGSLLLPVAKWAL
jgi:hypothetical protein